MRSIASLKQIGMCNAGTLATSPVNPLVFGYRGEATLKTTPNKNITDYRNRSLRNQINFNLSGKTYQATLEMLKSLIGWLNMQCDLQVITAKQSASANSEDVYKFVDNSKLGLSFEYMISDDERSVTPTFEGALEYDKAKALLDTADSENAVDLGFGTKEGITNSFYRYPYRLKIEAPQSTEIFSRDDISKREFKITVEGQTDAYNRMIAQFLNIELSVTGAEASVAKIVQMMGNEMSSSILLQEQNGADSSLYDAFDIAEGVLTQIEELSIGDTNRELLIKYSGKIPIYDVDFVFGTGNGGASDDTTGATGGTMRIGY